MVGSNVEMTISALSTASVASLSVVCTAAHDIGPKGTSGVKGVATTCDQARRPTSPGTTLRAMLTSRNFACLSWFFRKHCAHTETWSSRDVSSAAVRLGLETL